MIRFRIAAAILILVTPAPGHSQARQPAVDSVAVFVITKAILRELADQLTLVVRLPGEKPWRVSVPDSSSPVWQRVQRGFETMLQARPVTARDNRYQFLEVVVSEIRGDTLDFHFTIGQRWRCSGSGWTLSSYSYEATAVRVGTWQTAKVGTIIATDPAYC